MSSAEYLAAELSRIGTQYCPETREYTVIRSIVELLMELQTQKNP